MMVKGTVYIYTKKRTRIKRKKREKWASFLFSNQCKNRRKKPVVNKKRK